MKGRGFVRVWAVLVLLVSLSIGVGGASSAMDERGAEAAVGTVASAALSTSFTYQGLLRDGSGPVNATCDLEFKLWDAASGGSQVGWTWLLEDVVLEDGLFTARLDFGAEAFRGQARYLEVAASCPVGSAFVPLPRQELTGSPYALWALGAPWSGLEGVPADLLDGDQDTTYTPGAGLVLEGTEFRVNRGEVQWRVSQTCAAGSSIRAIDVDGTVTCETDDNTTYGAGTGLSLVGGQFSVNFAGTGSASTVARSDHNHADAYWSLTGNTGTVPGTNYLGTSDNAALVLKVNNTRALRIEPSGEAPNLIGGWWENYVDAGVVGATIGGGGSGEYGENRVTDMFGTIGGGVFNQAGDNTAEDFYYPTVSGGYHNSATKSWSTVGGGGNNTASHTYSTVSGGDFNSASGYISTVGGGGNNIASGGVSTVSGGGNNTSSYFYATVGGGRENLASNSDSTIAGGLGNTASGDKSAIAGGNGNTASGDVATVGGGQGNAASNQYTTVGGGYYNNASGDVTTVGGGQGNAASDTYAAVGGGVLNTASGYAATVAGGAQNTASGQLTTISGGGHSTDPGLGNRATDDWGTVGGGFNNQAGDDDADTTDSAYATVSGGRKNVASGYASTISGGYGNTASHLYATVCGGWTNTASEFAATVGGGEYNTVSGAQSTVGGGWTNTASGQAATVGGGYNNVAQADSSTVGGGWTNTASANAATVPGGASNIASGSYSLAAGAEAHATHDGSFVWSSATATDSWGTQTFTVRSHGGARFYSASGTGTGVQLSAGGTSFGSISDRNAKEAFAPVDTTQLLEALAGMPVQTWNLKSQAPDMRHIGPVAQDFNGSFAYLFGEVESPIHINNMDAVGVSLAASQGLYELSQEQAIEIAGLQAENTALRDQLDNLEARLASLEAGQGAGGTSSRMPSGWLLLGSVLAVGAVVGRRAWGGGR